MNTIEGVSVELYLNEDTVPLKPEKFGYLGRFNEGDVIEMRITAVSSPSRVFLKTKVDRTDAREIQARLIDGIPTIFHQVSVIHDPGRTSAIADQNTNCVRFVEMDSDMDSDGMVSVVNIEVISQKGDFFRIFHPTYRVQAYEQVIRGFRRVAVPGLFGNAGFPELVQFVEKYYLRRSDIKLPSVESYADKPLPKTDWLPDNNYAVIMFWSTARGVGVGIRRDGQLVKLHHSNVIVASRTPIYFSEGEVVHIESYRRPHSRQSSLDFEGVGIRRREDLEPPFESVA